MEIVRLNKNDYDEWLSVLNTVYTAHFCFEFVKFFSISLKTLGFFAKNPLLFGESVLSFTVRVSALTKPREK